jgi:hypothetical protein
VNNTGHSTLLIQNRLHANSPAEVDFRAVSVYRNYKENYTYGFMRKVGFMKTRFVFYITVLSILYGCTGHMPQTADEFRKGLPDAFMGKVEKFQVNRSYTEVGRSFQKMAPQCLDVRIKTTSQTNTSYQVIVTKWNPTVRINDQKAELHIQQLHEQGVLNVYEVPDKGYYMMVVDAIPLGNNSSEIVMYRSSVGNKALIKAIKGWAAGEKTGCPDLTA